MQKNYAEIETTKKHAYAAHHAKQRALGRELKYDIIRVILIILVLLSHSAYYDIRTPFGGIYYETMMLSAGISDTKIHLAIKVVSNFLYSFHMPAFFALSGIIFWRQISQDRWTFNTLIVGKFKRLLIPLFGVWLFWNIPIKYISGYYQDVPYLKIILQLIFPNRVYLWFLESLFFVFVIVYLLIKYVVTVQ